MLNDINCVAILRSFMSCWRNECLSQQAWRTRWGRFLGKKGENFNVDARFCLRLLDVLVGWKLLTVNCACRLKMGWITLLVAENPNRFCSMAEEQKKTMRASCSSCVILVKYKHSCVFLLFHVCRFDMVPFFLALKNKKRREVIGRRAKKWNEGQSLRACVEEVH